MSADEALASKQVEQALEAAIAALEPMYREVLLLRDVEGLTAPEVARVTGASVQAVKSRLQLDARMNELKPTDAAVIVYCRSGQRSGSAARMLKSAGFAAVHDLGPMSRW